MKIKKISIVLPVIIFLSFLTILVFTQAPDEILNSRADRCVFLLSVQASEAMDTANAGMEATSVSIQPIKPVYQKSAESNTGDSATEIQVEKLKIAEPVSIPSGIGAVSQIVANCAVDKDLLEEMENLISEIEKAKKEGNEELVEELSGKIKLMRERIYERQEKCKNEIESKKDFSQKGNETFPIKPIKPLPVQSQSGSGSGPSLVAKNFCQLEKEMQGKLNYYKNLISLKADELEAKGYDSKEEVAKIIEGLNREMEKAHLMCVNPPRHISTTSPIIIKPVVPDQEGDIISYYKEKLSEVMSEKPDVKQEIGALENLRNDVNGMVKELIRTKKKIRYFDIKPLVQKIVVTPGKIQTDKITVETSEEKSVDIPINGQENEISVNKDVVTIGKSIKAKALAPIKIDNGKILLGDKELKVTPDQAVKKAKADYQSNVELIKENEKLVYRIKDIQPKKVLWIFPVKVSRQIDVDATKEGGEVLKIKKPWWSFLAF